MSGKMTCKGSFWSRLLRDPLSCMLFATSSILFAFSLIFSIMSHLA